MRGAGRPVRAVRALKTAFAQAINKGAPHLGQAVEAEVGAWLSTHTDKLTDDGRRRLVRHGHLPEREIMTGIGAVAVRCPRVRDRVGEGGERIRRHTEGKLPFSHAKAKRYVILMRSDVN